MSERAGTRPWPEQRNNLSFYQTLAGLTGRGHEDHLYYVYRIVTGLLISLSPLV